jgi:hypothetical protein
LRRFNDKETVTCDKQVGCTARILEITNVEVRYDHVDLRSEIQRPTNLVWDTTMTSLMR